MITLTESAVAAGKTALSLAGERSGRSLTPSRRRNSLAHS